MLQKVRPFMAADADAVAQIFENVPDGWSKNALQKALQTTA